MSSQPKIEVAAGMIVEKPANDEEFFDEDKINREMFGAADEIIYSAVLAGADFVQGGENQSADSFISAHDISEGISIKTLREFKIFVERFNSAQKIWSEGIIFDEEEIINDANNFFVDKRGRDIKILSVEPIFIAELKVYLGTRNWELGTSKKISAAEKVLPREKIYVGENFINDFNALEKLSGFSGRQAREKFIHRYKIRAFSCSNVEERMNRPKISPKFSETTNSAGDFWACGVEGNIFVVVPNLKNYTENHHTERAFGLVFESNFVGGTYSRFRVEQAALFEMVGNEFKLKQRGKIILSK